MASITLHGIDPELEQKLRAAAAQNHSSLNKTIQGVLREALGITKGMGKKSDFSDLAGTWTEADALEFEECVRDQSQIDEEMWK